MMLWGILPDVGGCVVAVGEVVGSGVAVVVFVGGVVGLGVGTVPSVRVCERGGGGGGGGGGGVKDR